MSGNLGCVRGLQLRGADLRCWATVRTEPSQLCLDGEHHCEQAQQHPEYCQLPVRRRVPMLHRVSLPSTLDHRRHHSGRRRDPRFLAPIGNASSPGQCDRHYCICTSSGWNGQCRGASALCSWQIEPPTACGSCSEAWAASRLTDSEVNSIRAGQSVRANCIAFSVGKHIPKRQPIRDCPNVNDCHWSGPTRQETIPEVGGSPLLNGQRDRCVH